MGKNSCRILGISPKATTFFVAKYKKKREKNIFGELNKSCCYRNAIRESN